MTIKVLDKDTVARIAAGEVVERPAAVVKELVENSIDAGATHLSVNCLGGGVGLIEVSDDGCGIPTDEIEVAFERHATSKLASAIDLDSIRTLGFRGEALPSIAAVAEVELVSSARGGDGSYISTADGRRLGSGPRARARGTTVTVRNLFRSVPARLKFLRSTSTQNSHIADVVTQYALAYPEISFTLNLDGRSLLNTPGTGRLLDSAVAVFGPNVARSLIDVKRGDSHHGVTVTGLVGSPELQRPNRDSMSFFVNRRWVSGRVLSKAVEGAYHGMLTVGKHPVSVINIEMPSNEVDVNIHPAKTDVRFQNDSLVFGAVQRAVKAVLVETSPVPGVQQPAATYSASPPVLPASPPLRRWDWLPPASSTARDPERSPSVSLPWNVLPALRVLGQVEGTYIVAEGPDGLYVIDQHAAHERIMFERVEKQRKERGVEVQGFLEPVTFQASPREDAQIGLQGALLNEFGFHIEPFGGTTYIVRSAPAGLDAAGCVAALRETLTGNVEGVSWEEKIAQSLACHSAVRAGKVLTAEEMRALVRQLEQTSMPHTCPHGRPTMIRLSLHQLERDFKRT